MKPYRGEDVYDAADRAHEEYSQRLTDAFCDGLKVGRMGLGAGLCPQFFSNKEMMEWLRGFREGAAGLLTERKVA